MRGILAASILGGSLLAGLLLLHDGTAEAGSRGGSDLAHPDFVVTQLPVSSGSDWRASASPGERYPVGSQVVLVRGSVAGSEVVRVLSRGLVAAGAPDVSPAGDSVVFTGRDAGSESWCIFEARLDGTSPRRVASVEGDCFDPVYLPADRIAFVVVSNTQGGARSESYLAVQGLAEHAAESGPEPISFGPGAPLQPTMLPDGRLLFSMRTEVAPGSGADPGFSLFTMNPDGTMLEPFRGQHDGAGSQMRARWSNSGVAFLSEEGGAGLVSMARPRGECTAFGARFSEGSVASARILTVDPIPDAGWLVTGYPDGASSASVPAVYWRNEEDSLLHPLFADPVWDLVEAVAVVVEPVPHARPSAVNPEAGLGTLVCYDADFGDGTVGPSPSDGPAVSMLLETLGTVGGAAGALAPREDPRTLARLGVESDGSFLVEVPADIPLRLTSFDAHDDPIATSAWFWVRPGEVRACFGCHESRDTAPRNRVVRALESEPQGVQASAGIAQQ